MKSSGTSFGGSLARNIEPGLDWVMRRSRLFQTMILRACSS